MLTWNYCSSIVTDYIMLIVVVLESINSKLWSIGILCCIVLIFESEIVGLKCLWESLCWNWVYIGVRYNVLVLLKMGLQKIKMRFWIILGNCCVIIVVIRAWWYWIKLWNENVIFWTCRYGHVDFGLWLNVVKN